MEGPARQQIAYDYREHGYHSLDYAHCNRRQRRRGRLFRRTSGGDRRGRDVHRPRRAPRGASRARPSHRKSTGQHRRAARAGDRRSRHDRPRRYRLFHRQTVRHRSGGATAAAAHRTRHARRSVPERRRQRRDAHPGRGTCARRRRTTYVAAVIAEPGVIRHTAMELIFGPLDGERPPMLEASSTRAGTRDSRAR